MTDPATARAAQYARDRQRRQGADSNQIRNALQVLIDKAPAGGFWHQAETESSQRNAFSLRLTPGGPIFTVEIRYGGATQ